MSDQSTRISLPEQPESERLANHPHALAMHRMYLEGSSLSQVAKHFEVTRQSVYGLFVYRGWPMRKKKTLPFVIFNGLKYTLNKHGYYRCTVRRKGQKSLLHQHVWETHHGEIPDGYDIHHRDENKENNDISNLECLPKAEHTRLYSPHNNQHTRGHKRRSPLPEKHCLFCGAVLARYRHGGRLEPRGDFLKRVFCGPSCHGMWRRGKPLETSARDAAQPQRSLFDQEE